MQAMLKIMKNEPPTLEPHPEWPSSLTDFLSDCLQKDPSKRLSAQQLLLKYNQSLWSKSRDGQYILEQLKVSQLGELSALVEQPTSLKALGGPPQQLASEKISVKTASSVDADSQDTGDGPGGLRSGGGGQNVIQWNFDLEEDEG